MVDKYSFVASTVPLISFKPISSASWKNSFFTHKYIQASITLFSLHIFKHSFIRYEFKGFSFSQGTGKISEEGEVFYFNGGGGSGYGYGSLSGYWIFNGDYAGNVKATAQWTANTYTINFNASGGSVSTTSKSVIYDSTYGTLPTPTRTGYTFNGWYDSNENKISSNSTVNIASNHTLTAQWTAKTYTITFDGNGGELPENIYAGSSLSDALILEYNTTSYYSWEVLAYAERGETYVLTGYYDSSSGGN